MQSNIRTKFETGSAIKTDNDELIYIKETSLILKFPKKRNCITTSWLNGGFKNNITAIYNHSLSSEDITRLETENKNEYMINKAKQLYLSPENTTGLITLANMYNVGFSVQKYKKLTVLAIVTGGTRVNAVRAGDPASFYEENGEYDLTIGTINIILLINANLNENTLLNAMMTATEAKSAILNDLRVASRYSNDIATGTGTDGISIVSDPDSDNILDNAGKHSKLGELIGKAVMASVSEALAREVTLSPETQRNSLLLLARYETDLNDFYNTFSIKEKEEFIIKLQSVNQDPELVSYCSIILHILDDINRKIISRTLGIQLLDEFINKFLSKNKYIEFKSFINYIINKQLE